MMQCRKRDSSCLAKDPTFEFVSNDPLHLTNIYQLVPNA